MPPRVADGEGKRREITLSVTVGDSSPEGRADYNVHSPEKIIVSEYRMLRNIEEISLDKIQKSDLT